MNTRHEDKDLRNCKQDRRDGEQDYRPSFLEDVKYEEGFEEVEKYDADEGEEEVEDVEWKMADFFRVESGAVADKVAGRGGEGGIDGDVGYTDEEDEAGAGDEGDGKEGAVVEELVAD